MMSKKLSPEEAARRQFNKVKKECIERILRKKNGINWPCELKIVNKLTETYPNIDFWRTFNVNFNFALPSMAWFLTEKGKDYLATEYRRATTDLSALISKTDETPELDFNEPIEKVEVKKKVLTLKDFLK